MKTTLSMILPAALLLALPGCMLAQQLGIRVPITVRAFVHDTEGRPIEGARVNLSLPIYGRTITNESTAAFTNREGVATVSGGAQSEYAVGVSKAGYYHTTGPRRGINTEKGAKQYAVGVQQIDLELRPIKNPIRSITKFVDRLRMPVADKPLGFDLEAGDWVAPYGRGRTSDFIFKLEGRFNSVRDYNQSMMLTFGNVGDGIILTKFPPQIGSDFKFPYEAPVGGYESQRIWKMGRDEKGISTTADHGGETNYIFRVRTSLDERGNVRAALYGVITGELIPVGGNNEIGREVNFTYILNPDWTRNLEFDQRQKVPVGKLPVSPPPSQ
jgi:hypothetical protein